MKLVNATIVTPKRVIKNGAIKIRNQRIESINETPSSEGINCRGFRVFPGFIDMHVHGTNNADFMDAKPASISTILTTLPKEGTTALLATTMTESLDKIEAVLNVISEPSNHEGAKMLGIHLEGPFINKAYQGAQNPAFIIKGTIDIFNRLQTVSRQSIKVVTLAPETQDDAFLEHLHDEDIIVSMGHSEATHEAVIKAMGQGIKRVTHCYNAMRTFHHRDIGLVGSALLYDDLNIELIADLKHVSAPGLKLAYKTKKHAIQLVTDAIRAKNRPDGSYKLGGQMIHVKNGTPFTETGHFAGSTLHMNEAALNMKTATGLDDVALSHMLATHQAKELKLDHQIGSIKEGLYADLTIVDDNFSVVMTIINGEIYYRNEALI